MYPICQLNITDINKPFIFLVFQLLLCNCAVALSNMCSCIFVSIEMSTVVLACAMEITRLYSAFFVSPVLLDTYPLWKVRNKRQDETRLVSLSTPRYWIFCVHDLLQSIDFLLNSRPVLFISSQFFDQISYMKFGYIGLVLNEYRGLRLTCAKKSAFAECATSNDGTFNASVVLRTNGYDRYDIGYCAGCMVVYIAVCRIASYLALRFIKV